MHLSPFLGRWLAAALLPLLLADCPLNSGVSWGVIEHDGHLRTYRLYTPSTYDGGEAVPLLIALHPFTGNARTFARMTDFDRVAESAGFIVVYPDGLLRRWNHRDAGLDARSSRLRADDMGFLTALLGRLQDKRAIDPARVYVAGASNGGFMTMRLVCERPDLFAGAAVVMATMPAELESLCLEGPPVPFMLIHGDEDPLILVDGGEPQGGFGPRAPFLSAADTAAVWVNRNGCGLAPDIETPPEKAPHDGTRVRIERYDGCQNGAEVRYYEIEGGGHTWPGQPLMAPRFIVGRISQELDASAEIWEFFSRHSGAD